MKQLFGIFIVITFLFISCDDDSRNVAPEVFERKIELSVYYEPEYGSSMTKIPDYKAKVFVYYDVFLDEAFTFDQGNILKRKGTIVNSPQQVFEIGEDGCITIIPKYEDKQILVIIESNYYSGKLSSISYPRFKINYKSSFLFTKSLSSLNSQITN